MLFPYVLNVKTFVHFFRGGGRVELLLNENSWRLFLNRSNENEIRQVYSSRRQQRVERYRYARAYAMCPTLEKPIIHFYYESRFDAI